MSKSLDDLAGGGGKSAGKIAEPEPDALTPEVLGESLERYSKELAAGDMAVLGSIGKALQAAGPFLSAGGPQGAAIGKGLSVLGGVLAHAFPKADGARV